MTAGKTGCRKSYFMLKLSVNSFFGKTVKTEWVSSIQLSMTREVEVHSSLICDVSLYYPQTLKAFDNLVEDFKLKLIDDTDSTNNNNYRENKKTDRLIVMDNVLHLADCSNIFASFLTVTRKFGHHCVYIFHIILPEKEIWKKIISEINIFNIFLASVLFQSIMKILQANVLEQEQDIYQLGLCG